ncbi:MAG TPA: choline/ethanolamine kinase family protein [Anaerolineales bacterium]
MPLTLVEAIARVPHWAGAEDLRATPLSGGITNCNYRIDIGGEAFVLRIAGADTELLGINREYEYAANLAAGRLGIAPDVYYFIRPEGYLVTRFIAGRLILPDEIRRPENIRRVMDTLRKIHNMADIPGTFNAFEIIREYADIARRYQVAFPQGYALLNVHLQEAEKTLLAHPDRPCPCHNDLLNGNFITNGQLTILDWEYAGMGDLFFDLANFSDHHDLSDEQDRWLLKYYFDEQATPEHWAHLKIMKIISEVREATWGLVQIGISKLDFDFREYADKFFGRVFDNIQKSQWNEWLKEVSKNV